MASLSTSLSETVGRFAGALMQEGKECGKARIRIMLLMMLTVMMMMILQINGWHA